MSVTLTHNGLSEIGCLKDLLTLLDTEGRANGLTSNELVLAKYYLLKMSAGDFQEGRICAIWQRITKTAEELGWSERAVTRAENGLIAKRYGVKTNAPKSQRSGAREKDGKKRIIWAAGFNFQPLINVKVAELKKQAKLRAREREALRLARAETKRLFSEIRALGCPKAMKPAFAVLPYGRVSRIYCSKALRKTIAIFSHIMSFYRKRRVEKAVEEHKSGLAKAPSKTDKSASLSNTTQKHPFQNSRFASGKVSWHDCLETAHPDALEYMRILGGYTQTNFIEAATLLRRDLSIPDELWGKACLLLGRVTAASLVSVIYRNSISPPNLTSQAISARACFKGALDKADTDTLFLNRFFAKNLKGA
ncbi:hypothetical protein E1162_15120 [Rhodobacteraceae bacterium RKSG542]|uniref:helix-turn-helix domain-containing protein n=1 Tax=Pseudovibrio flavus TaxID=2529854 RepID=UPI0012BBD33A|nr:helix-turn-helix domain-containing protein [Pseudovibrio flavus]MTI18575.1 hypothetical protein [Pseudovibrio flavus]